MLYGRRMRTRFLLAVATALTVIPPAAGAEIVGRARIIDGNTITIAGRCIRLAGIAAPATQQMCRAGGRDWFCGQDASFALARIIETHWVYCAERARTTDGCVVAVCNLSGKTGPEVNAEMVREGWARATDPAAYGALEAAARKAGAGIWRGQPANAPR